MSLATAIPPRIVLVTVPDEHGLSATSLTRNELETISNYVTQHIFCTSQAHSDEVCAHFTRCVWSIKKKYPTWTFQAVQYRSHEPSMEMPSRVQYTLSFCDENGIMFRTSCFRPI